MVNLFKGNNFFKIVSVLLAVLLWFYVTNEQSPLDQSTREVALEIRNLPTNLAVREIQGTVRVKIQGSRTLLANISPANIDAYVDLARAKVGVNDLPVELNLPTGIKKIKVSPPKVSVLVDTISEKQVPVVVKKTGSAAKGFEILTPVIRPSSVIVRGPQGLLETIVKAEVRITLQNQNRSFVTNLPVEVVNDEGQVLDTRLIRVIPGTVELSFPVIKAEPSKIVPVSPQVAGKPARGYKVVSMVAVPSEVQIFGPAGKIESLAAVKTTVVDITGQTGEKVQDVELQLPEGFSVPPYTKVKVIIKIGR